MAVRKLGKEVRESLWSMVHLFASKNEKKIPDSDKVVLGAIVDELQKGDNVDLNVQIDRKTGKVVLKCNDIKYQFSDPTLNEPASKPET